MTKTILDKTLELFFCKPKINGMSTQQTCSNEDSSVYFTNLYPKNIESNFEDAIFQKLLLESKQNSVNGIYVSQSMGCWFWCKFASVSA